KLPPLNSNGSPLTLVRREAKARRSGASQRCERGCGFSRPAVFSRSANPTRLPLQRPCVWRDQADLRGVGRWFAGPYVETSRTTTNSRLTLEWSSLPLRRMRVEKTSLAIEYARRAHRSRIDRNHSPTCSGISRNRVYERQSTRRTTAKKSTRTP